MVEPVTAHTRRLLVLVEVATQSERLAAAATHVRLVGRVRLDVRPQVGLVGERLAAVRAPERLQIKSNQIYLLKYITST